MEKSQLISSLRAKDLSEEIINAFEKVPRENFVPYSLRQEAYEDTALSLGIHGATISQPYTIAEMLSLLELKKGQRVLEVGSGCGYVLALLSKIVGKTGKVYGIEIIKELAEKSRKNLNLSGYDIEVYNKSGIEGLEEESPFNKILISAASENVPQKLFEQLKENGILVAPIGPHGNQSLIAFQKINNKIKINKQLPGFVFVPLVD